MVLILAMPMFCVLPIRFQTVSLAYSKPLFIISCNAVPRKQLQSQPQIEQKKENEERRHNAIKQLLMEECGFSSSETMAVLDKSPSLSKVRSTEGAHQAVNLLRDSGFTPEQVRNTIHRYPTVLQLKAHERLEPTIAYFRTLGFNAEEVARVISRHPRLLGFSLSKTISPKTSILLNLFGSQANLYKALRVTPEIIVYNIEILKVKLKFMENMGLSKNEVTELLSKSPRFLVLSTDKIHKTMDFLKNTARLAPQIVVKHPVLLTLSVENRLKPRYIVFEYLNSSLSPKHRPISLFTMMRMSEDLFFERVLAESPEAKRLYGQ